MKWKIAEISVPDITVNQFLTRLSALDRDLYRHVPHTKDEYQVFALKEEVSILDPIHADDILAYMHFTETGSDELTVGLAIDPHMRGTGLGREMYRLMPYLAKNYGAKRLKAEVFPHNLTAVKRQLEIGFKFYGPVYITHIDLEED